MVEICCVTERGALCIRDREEEEEIEEIEEEGETTSKAILHVILPRTIHQPIWGLVNRQGQEGGLLSNQPINRCS